MVMNLKISENIFNYFFPQIFAEINNLEIMSTDNYEVSRNLLKYMGNFENGEMESFIRLNPYWDQIN